MQIAAKIANGILNSKPAVFLTKPNAPAAAATIALISNLTKDAVNCYYYVNQSLTNDRIPDDKRKFVAGLDLANGILNVVTQTAIGVILPIFTNKVFDKKIVPKFFSPDAVKELSKSVLPKLSKDLPFESFVEIMEKNKGYAKVGLSVIATLVGTQIIAKRIIVPLLATPMATYFRKKFEASEKKNNGDTVTFTNNPNTKTENLPKCFHDFMK